MTEHTTPEPVAWMDTTGDFYVQDLRRRSVAGPRTREVFSTNGADLENYTALYDHPPVTAEPEVERLREKVAFLDAALRRAEPATAPSVEQIAEVPSNHQLTQPGIAKPWHCEDAEGRFCRTYAHDDDFDAAMNKHVRHVAEAIHALYGEPEVAQQPLAEWEAQILRDAEIQGLRAEVERYKAALEAAEKRETARQYAAHLMEQQERAEAIRIEADAAYIRACETYSAARAAVEAETTPPQYDPANQDRAAANFLAAVEAETSEEAGA